MKGTDASKRKRVNVRGSRDDLYGGKERVAGEEKERGKDE